MKPSFAARGLAAALAVVLACRFLLLFRLNLNWDEFHYLSFVYDYLRGAPLAVRQTLHVHLFAWLPAVLPEREVAQLVAARLVLFALSLAASWLLYRAGRRLLSRPAALFALLCYHATAEVVLHGASFRPDPLAGLLVAGAAAGAVLLGGAAAPLVAGAVCGLSLTLTLKTLFFLPTVAVLLLTAPDRPWRPRRAARDLALYALALTGVAAALTALHRLAIQPHAAAGAESVGLGRLAGSLLWTGHWFPGRFYLVRSLADSALVWLLVAGGVAAALAGLRQGEHRRRSLAMLALVAPLATLVFYRNAFPYFYALLLVPAVLACGFAWDRLGELLPAGRARRAALAALAAGVLGTGLAHALRNGHDQLSHQRQLLAVVHRMFPEPVPYIDRCSMVPSFPKVGFFMSSWGMDHYLRAGEPLLSRIVRRRQPVFVLANSDNLNLLLPEEAAARLRFPLLAADRRTLRQSYVHHWGALFVAGRRLELDGGEPVEVELAVAGPYTLEAAAPVRLDGRRLAPGETVTLAAGRHTVTAEQDGPVVLRWGERLYRPPFPPPPRPIFEPL